MALHRLPPVALVGLLLTVVSSTASCERASPPLPRIGAAEEFHDVAGWELRHGSGGKPPAGTPAPSLTSDGEIATLSTPMRGDPGLPAGQRMAIPSTSTFVRSLGPVDLDRHPYLVVSNPTRSVMTWFAVDGKAVPIAFTTGITAVDLRHHGFAGRKRLELLIRAYNTGGRATFDYVRFVSELTDEERAGLVPPGYRVPMRSLSAHPYHELETLLARQGGFRLPVAERPPEQAAFRDTGTHARIRQWTGGPGTDGVPSAVSDDGRYVLFPGRERGLNLWVCDLSTGELQPTPFAPSAPVAFEPESGRLLYLHIESARAGEPHPAIYGIWDPANGATQVLLRGEIPTKVRQGLKVTFDPATRRVLLVSRRHPAGLLIDPRAERKGDRWLALGLPFPMHSLGFTATGSAIFGYIEGTGARQLLRFDDAVRDRTARGDPRLRWDARSGIPVPSGGDGHGPFDARASISNFRPVKVLWRAPEITDDRPGDKIRIAFNWLPPAPKTDYGTFSPDHRWVAVDGIDGPVKGQLLLMSLDDPATVMPFAFHNTSSITWGAKPYLRFSPDATKVFYGSDMLGRGRVYSVRIARPRAPVGATLDVGEGGRALRWQPAPGVREAAGFHVYGEDEHGVLTRLNAERLARPQFEIPGTVTAKRFRVTHVEHAGLESAFSDPAAEPGAGPVRIVREAERGRVEPPFRQHFDGRLSGDRAVEVARARDDEEGRPGTLRFEVTIPSAGRWRALARVRGGALRIAAGSGAPVPIEAGGTEWRWVASEPFALAQGEQEIRVEADADGAGLDLLVLTNEPDPWIDEPPAGSLALPEGLAWRIPSGASLEVRAEAVSPFAVRVAWSAGSALEAWPGPLRARVHAARAPERAQAGNRHVLGLTSGTSALDAGLEPEARYSYLVQVVDSRDQVLAEGRAVAETPPHARFLKVIEAETLTTPSLAPRSEGDTAFVASKPGADGRLAFDVRVPRTGDYWLWFRHRVQGGTPPRWPILELRGRLLRAELHRFVVPGEKVGAIRSRPDARVGTRWNEDPLLVAFQTNSLRLERGANPVSLSWEGGRGRETGEPFWLEIDRITVTDDPSWRPAGWDPRIDFVPEARGAAARD